VKVDKKTLEIDGQAVNLVLWDLAGEDEVQKVSMSYLRGASGYLLVIDRTRRATVDTAADLVERVAESVGPVPFVAVFNKSDLTDEQEIDDEAMTQIIMQRQWEGIAGSAKTGEGVEEAFDRLARKITA
jgi:small GTP-binding protein